jgi:hypothetical protein
LELDEGDDHPMVGQQSNSFCLKLNSVRECKDHAIVSNKINSFSLETGSLSFCRRMVPLGTSSHFLFGTIVFLIGRMFLHET